MSDGKSGAPVDCSPPDSGAVGTVAAIPLVVAGLAAVGIAKGVQAGYRFIKKTRAESSKTADELWLSEMKQAPLATAISPASKVNAAQLLNLEVSGIKLDNVFNHLRDMNTNTKYNSGLFVSDYSFTDSSERTVFVQQAGTDNKIAFTKDEKGQYHAFGNSALVRELESDVRNVINTFYINELNHRLSHEWGFMEVNIEQTPQIYKFTATDTDKHEMTVEINKKTGQPSFNNIPNRLRTKIEKWLNEFTECRVTKTGDAAGIKTKGGKGGRIRS